MASNTMLINVDAMNRRLTSSTALMNLFLSNVGDPVMRRVNMMMLLNALGYMMSRLNMVFPNVYMFLAMRSLGSIRRREHTEGDRYSGVEIQIG